MQVTVHNTGQCPRGLYDVEGRLVTVAPGETATVEVREGRDKRKREGLSVVPVERPQVLASPDLEPLRAEAKRLGLEIDGRWGVATLMRKVDEARTSANNEAAPGAIDKIATGAHADLSEADGIHSTDGE